MARARLPPRIVPLGDGAVFAEFSQTLELDVNARIQRLAARIRQRRLAWVRDVVPALAGLALHFDPDCFAGPGRALDAASALIADCLKDANAGKDVPPRVVDIPVCYEAEFAADLPEVAERCKLKPEEIIRRHAGSAHRVLMVGFAPGQPYIGGLDPKLAVPRRATPRPKVPAGSVAIANTQSVVYSLTISGGWSIIGRTPLAIFDALREPPVLLCPGDGVRFIPIARAEYQRLAGAGRQ